MLIKPKLVVKKMKIEAMKSKYETKPKTYLQQQQSNIYIKKDYP